jgi:protein TonB
MGAALAGHRFIEPRLPDPLSLDRGSALAGASDDAERQPSGGEGATAGGMFRSILPSIVLHAALIAMLIPAMTGSSPPASPSVMVVSLATLPAASPSTAASDPPTASSAQAQLASNALPQNDLPMAPPRPEPRVRTAVEPVAPAPAIEPAKPVPPKPTGASLPIDRMADLSPLTHAEAIDLKRAERPRVDPVVRKSVDVAKPQPVKSVKAKPQPLASSSKLMPKPETAQPAARPVDAPVATPSDTASRTPTTDNKPVSTQASSSTQAASTPAAQAPAALAVATAGNAAPATASSAPVVITDPNYAGRCHYKYPESARRRNLEGTVVIRALIDTDGKAASVTIISSSGFDLLDSAARRAISDCAFTPQRVDGRPVQAIVDVPIPFKLI